MKKISLNSVSFRRAFIVAAALFCVSQTTMANTAVDQLSECLVQSTTAADKTTVLQWTFVALSNHPQLKAFSHVSAEQKNALDQQVAQTLQRILVEQCSTQAKTVIQTQGLQGIGQSFQELGSITGEEIIKTPEVKQQLNGVVRYVDLNKLMTTFLTPEILNQFGL